MPTIISYSIILRIIRSQVFSLLYKTKSTSRSSVFMRTIFAKYIGPFSLNLLQVSSSGSIKKHVDQDLSSQSYNSKIYFVIHLLVCGYRRVPEYQGFLKSALSSLSNRSEKLLFMIWKMLALYICWHPVTRVSSWTFPCACLLVKNDMNCYCCWSLQVSLFLYWSVCFP